MTYAPMTGKQMLGAGLIDTRTAIIRALMGDGFDRAEADELVESIVSRDRPAPWKRWTDEELAAIREAVTASGGKLPGRAVTRELADRFGRSLRSITSCCERIAGGMG